MFPRIIALAACMYLYFSLFLVYLNLSESICLPLSKDGFCRSCIKSQLLRELHIRALLCSIYLSLDRQGGTEGRRDGVCVCVCVCRRERQSYHNLNQIKAIQYEKCPWLH